MEIQSQKRRNKFILMHRDISFAVPLEEGCRKQLFLLFWKFAELG